VAIRNLFAFLTGQPLVATKTHPTPFAVFLQIALLLQEFWYTSADGSSFGQAVDLSFGFFVGRMALADVRHSREKTLEALILGEQMRSLELYNEAFAHAVGKYSAIVDIRSPLFGQVSKYTQQRLERAHLDLVRRLDNVNTRLEKFEFPSIFAGTANSTSNPNFKQVRFKVWIKYFEKMKAFVLGHYKTALGNWPPKASSKKNPFSESGLNRLVLKLLYSDLCALYDLIVDRHALTPRVIDEAPEDAAANDISTLSALRKILSEFDHSQPPVLPPIPYDIPIIPTMTTVLETYNDLPAKEQGKMEKKLKENEILRILQKAYNHDTNALQIPFLKEFKEFEMKEARGRPVSEIADQRIGYWLFLYAVIQCLPMLVVDAPGLRHTEGVEYFLCEPPMGNPPWLEDGPQVHKTWYEVAGGTGYVELSADAVMFSVEAIYHRSHCWLAAREWEGIQGAGAAPLADAALSPLEPPPAVFRSPDPMQSPPLTTGGPSPPGGSPPTALQAHDVPPNPRGRIVSRGHANRSSIALGLEPVAPMADGLDGIHPAEAASFAMRTHNRGSSLGPRPASSSMRRNVSMNNLNNLNRNSLYTESTTDSSGSSSGATFDDIFAKHPQQMKKKSRLFRSGS
jgi:hypothetical protein